MATHIPKRILCIAFLFLSLLPAWSHEGSIAGAGKLRVSQTKYFDIIYSEKNLATAQILYENADRIFEEITAAYGYDANYRLPVVITTTVEQFNAYYADSPYNRIVIYDTAQIDDLAVFSQTLLSTFTHELTHAVTYNLKNGTMRALGKIFGDAFANHYITVTSGMAEGATVSYESSNGEGRLNDPYALQQIRQAKIEGKFPTYSDVKGASDAYPRNSFYYFNGAFADFLQKNYGMQKYAEFWYRCINIESLTDITAGGAFKYTYGMKINQAWELFEQSLEVPKVAAPEPVAAGQAYDFFKPENEKPSIKNKAGSLYTNLCAGGDILVFSDESCDTVYAYKNGKVKKLFTRDYLDTLKLSRDGRFLTVGYYSSASATIKHKVQIYDLQSKKWISVKGTNYVDPAVISDGSNYYFVAQNYEPQKYSICVKKIEVNGRRVKVNNENLFQYYFSTEEVPSDFTDLGNGNFAFVLKSGLEYSVCVSDCGLTEIKKYVVPFERMKLRDLSATDSGLMFSWATKETMPRLGTLDLKDGTFSLSQENISGGIYTPVELKGHVYYTAHFFKETRLLELAQATLVSAPVCEEDSRVKPKNDIAVFEPIPYTSFNPFRYTFEGLLLPIAGLNSQTLLPGITYITASPWYSSLTIISGGYDTKAKAGIFSLSYESGTDTNLFQYLINSSLIVDKAGIKSVSGDVSAVTSFDFGKISVLSFSAEASVDYSRFLYEDIRFFLSTIQLVTAGYSNVVKTGPGTHEKAGINLVAGVVHSYETQLEPVEEKLFSLYDMEIDFSVNIPKLIPITCADNFTYNFPSTIKTYFFSLSSKKMRLARVNAETIVFAYDIQKAIPGVSAIFANNVLLSFGYTGGFDYKNATDFKQNWHFLNTPEYIDLIKNGELKYGDYYTLKLSLGLTPNIGSFANPQARTELYFCFNFGNSDAVPESKFNFGFEAKF